MRNAEEDLKVCNAATRGPWVDMASIVPHGKAYQEHVFDGCVVAGTGEGEILKSVACPPEYEEWEADAAFIALAREALPWWINRAVELEGEGDPYWINRALELETENLRLQKEVDRLLERERHAVHHSETYKRLVERTREVDKVRKEAKQLREAIKHAKEVPDMQKRICPDCGTIMFSAAAQEKFWKCIRCGADVEYAENSEMAADSE